MKDDDHVCLCFHVSKRKIVNFIRIEKPVRVSQISECLSAGTGCGWCRPILGKLFEQVNASAEGGTADSADTRISGFDDWSSEQYAQQRQEHIARKKSDQDKADASEEQ